MEAFSYTLILTLALVTLFFAVAFRDPPKYDKENNNKKSPENSGLFLLLFYLSYFGGSRNATAKKSVTSAKVSIST